MKSKYAIFISMALAIFAIGVVTKKGFSSDIKKYTPEQEVTDVYTQEFVPATLRINRETQEENVSNTLNAFSQALSAFVKMQGIRAESPRVQNATFVLLQRLKKADEAFGQKINRLYNNDNFLKLIINALNEVSKAIQTTPEGAQDLLKQLHDIYTWNLEADAQGKIRMYLNVPTFDEWYNKQKNNITAAMQARAQ